MQVGRGYSPSFCAIIKDKSAKKLGSSCNEVIDHIIASPNNYNEEGISLADVSNNQKVIIKNDDSGSGPRLCVEVHAPDRQKEDMVILGKPVTIFGKTLKRKSRTTHEQELGKYVSSTFDADPSIVDENILVRTITRAYKLYRKCVEDSLLISKD